MEMMPDDVTITPGCYINTCHANRNQNKSRYQYKPNYCNVCLKIVFQFKTIIAVKTNNLQERRMQLSHP